MAPVNIIYLIVIFQISFILHRISASNYGSCILEPKTNTTDHLKALSRLTPLIGEHWTVGDFTVNVCKGLNGVTGANNVVYGRTNCTHVAQADSWMLLEYRAGDKVSSSSSPPFNYTSQIFILCDRASEKGALTIIDQSESTIYFQLLSAAICPAEETSPGKVVFILILVFVSLYFLIGILYRRFTKNVRGCQQLPHFHIWSRVGAACADGCNTSCRCEEEEERQADVWVEDRDDVLLRP